MKLDQRRFVPATRPLNKHERRELMLNRYEDSLEAKRPMSAKRKKKRKKETAETTLRAMDL